MGNNKETHLYVKRNSYSKKGKGKKITQHKILSQYTTIITASLDLFQEWSIIVIVGHVLDYFMHEHAH